MSVLKRPLADARRALAPLLGWISASRNRRRLLRSGLFDPVWYAAAAPPLPRGTDPATHFLITGADEGRDPTPLFDTAWYMEQNPDVVRDGANPLLHYLLSGAAEGRDPNPFFSSAWYLLAYPDVAACGANPLAHYLAHGVREGRRPSPRFDPDFYLRQLPGDELGRAEPLQHFLTRGRSLGLKPGPDPSDLAGEPVEWADIHTLKPWMGPAAGETALFVTHAAAGRLKPHVRAHLEALRRADVDVILIVAGEALFVDETATGPLAGLYVRANLGFDFAAWAHLLKLLPALWDAPGLYLLNDSVVGPIGEEAYQAMMRRLRSSPADLVGLTESRERAWHLQSYFVFLRSMALRHARLQAFFNSVRSVDDKQAVIDGYEVTLAAEAVGAGLKVEALFQKGAQTNPTLFAWRELLAEGFPFLKASVITGRHDTVNSSGWREALQAAGADPVLGEALLEPPSPPSSPGVRTWEAAPWSPHRVAFYGPWNYANGLGEASRGYLSALWRLNGGLNLHGLKTPFHIHRRLTPGYDVRDFVEAADAAIVHLNPDAWHYLTPEQGRAIERARVRIGLWVWEMDRLPDFYRPNLDKVDVVWAPSRYCAEVFAAETGHPVHVVPHVVPVPAEPPGGEAFQRNILYIFDGSSYAVRKNPSALVEAFELSRLATRGWRLVLKTKNLGDHPVQAQAQALAERCAAVPGVTLIDRSISREEMAALMEAAAIYASPHASEGFGLTIAEAMAAGKVVVATDYGGSRDVLDESCGLPVGYDLATLTEDFGHYRKGGRWAAVRVDALAEALVRGAGSLERGERAMGAAARARIADRLSADRVAEAMRASFSRIAPLAAGIETQRRAARA